MRSGGAWAEQVGRIQISHCAKIWQKSDEMANKCENWMLFKFFVYKKNNLIA